MENEEGIGFVPVIGRLDHLDRQLQVLEEKHSLSRSDFSGRISCCAAAESKNECKSLSSALQEVQHKGTLMERLALLEKRVLELSLETDEEKNTSKSSSSTVPAAQEMQRLPKIQSRERDSSAEGAQQKSREKKKSKKRWLWLFRLQC